MEISVAPKNLQVWSGSLLVVGLLEENLEEQLVPLKTRFGDILIKSIEKKNFTGKSKEIVSYQLINDSLEKLVLLGLGKAEDLVLDDLRNATAIAAKESLEEDGVLGMYFPWASFDLNSASKAVAEATLLSLFKDVRFLSSSETRKSPSKLELIGLPDSSKDFLKVIKPVCGGVQLARELVGAPANRLTPAGLASTAELLAKEKNCQLKILEKKDCLKKGMGAYLAVCQGSDLDPKFIHLTYKPEGEINRKLVLIGKGLTFDSGGYNLKVGASQIEMMKFDMGGSAAVLGTAKAIIELMPKGVEVHFIIAACENMVNGSAVHPGDIIQASNGKTIEINNTDAEGRLTLADALVYASQLQPDAIVDLATLTGACVVALGDEIAGLWTGNDLLAENLTNSANEAGEGLWRMPLYQPYRDGLKSSLADLKNTGPRQGGSITAALFLKEFVDESIPWAHIDIAGPVWSEKGRGVNPAGATGYGVRTLVNWIYKEKNSIKS